MNDLYGKYLKEIQLVLKTTEKFEKENLAIKQILDYLENRNPEEFESTHFEEILYEFWKFYRSFKMKEFILLFKERIKAEISFIDSTSNKTIEMLDRAFLWHITNWSNDSKRKYEQRFYSIMALEQFSIDKSSYYKLSIANRNILIDLINETKKDSLFNKLILYPQKDQKTINEKYEEEIISFVEIQNLNLLDLITTSKIEDFKGLIHAFACQADSKIQLDHVLNRIAIKNYIEKLCDSFGDNIEKTIDQINDAVDLILPYMFGSVVHKEENDKLKSNLEIDINVRTNIWNEYIECKIKMFDFDTRLESKPKLIDDKKDYQHIEIHNAYDSIKLKDKVYNWCNANKTWY